ncbi:MAG: SPOR domain-containing protein [Bacteroidales bacterium]
MKIGIYISELLFDHENVILPGFGIFSTEYIPARFIPEEKKVESPSKVITFNEKISKGETPLIDHIARREAMDKEEVWKFVRNFVEQMEKSLNAGSKVELEKVGIFSKDPDGLLLFRPDTSINYLSDASGMSSVKEPGKTDEDNIFIAPVVPPAGPQQPQPDQSEGNGSQPAPVSGAEETQSPPPSADREPAKAKHKQGLPPAMKWLAYTVVPLLIIIIILAFNFRFFFGEGGLFGGSNQVAPVEQVATPLTQDPAEPEPEAQEPQAALQEEEQPEAIDPAAEPPRPEAGRPVYYIVVGSFENHHQAQALAEDLRKEGAPLASIFMQTPSGFYRVAYGYYYDLQQAEEQLQEVQTKVNSNAWILHR